MSALIPVALYGWPLAGLILFSWLGPRRGAIGTILAGWLVLPVAVLPSQGFIDIDKRAAISLGALAAVVILDFGRLQRFRLSRVDWPVLAWCLCALPTSLVNGLGVYDGLTSSLRQFLHWGAPWLMGRLYMADLTGLRMLCKATFMGGLAYAPLCLWEVRMSPSFHGYLYGIGVYQGISYRDDLGSWGSRPSVLLANPLELGMFMTTACLCGLALVWIRSERKMLGLRTSWLLAALFLVSLACKNLGATVLLMAGAAALYLARARSSLLLLQVLALVLPTYSLVRTSGAWDGGQVTELAGMVHEDKAASFEFRIRNENMLIEKALQRPLLGWGGWGRARVYDERGDDISVTDGLWVIALGMYGLFGLSLLALFLATPVLSGSLRIPRALIGHERLLPAITAMALVTLLAIDFVANNFPSPVILFAAGGAASLPPIRTRPARRAAGDQRRARPQPALPGGGRS